MNKIDYFYNFSHYILGGRELINVSSNGIYAEKRKNGLYQFIIFIYFLAISLPLHSSNRISSYITIPGTWINIFHLTLPFILMMVILKNIKRIELTFAINSFFVIIYLVSAIVFTFIGYKQGYDNYLSEFLWYFIPAIFYFAIRYISMRGFSLIDLMDLTFYAMFINCIINLIMFSTKNLEIWGLVNYLGNRFGGNYYTVLIMTFTYGIYMLYNKEYKINKILIISNCFVSIYCLMLAQSRATLVLCLFPSVLLLFTSLNNRYSKRSYIGRFFLTGLILITSIYLFYLFIEGESEIANRFVSMSIYSKDDTMMIRIVTFVKNIVVFFNNPLGHGLGYPLYFYNGYGSKIEEVAFLDNTFATIAIRGGIFMVIPYVYLIILSLKKMWKYYSDTKYQNYLNLIIMFMCFLIASTIMTGQTIHGFAVSVFFWAFISCSLNDMNINKYKKNSISTKGNHK